MRNFRFCISILFLSFFVCLGQAFSQTPAASPEVIVDDNEVVKINTNLIQVDAIVTDKKGKVINDLKPEDFELTENGKRREIVGFSFVNTDTRAASLSNDLVLSSSNSLFSDAPARTIGQVGRIYAIIFDDLTISQRQHIDYAKRDLVKFVQTEVQPGDLVAIIKTSGSVGVLQKFTNDKEELLATIDSIKWNPLSSVGGSAYSPIEISFSQQVLSNFGSGINAHVGATVGDNTALHQMGSSIRDTTNAVGGLQVLSKVIDAMGQMRGKKSILFVSYGVSKYTQSDRSVLNSTNGNSISLIDENSVNIGGKNFIVNNFLRVITESANRNGVSIFPIDPRGTATTNISATDTTGTGMGTMSRDQMESGVSNRNDTIRLQQDTLKYLARETGGKAFVNSNEVADDLKESLDIQKGYYLLAYEPDADTFDAKDSRYNKFDIKVKRSGADVSFRSGFFNVVTENKAKATTNETNVMQKLLSPYNFTDVGVELSSLYAGTAGNKSTIRAFVNILPKYLETVNDADGKKSAKFDIFVAVFNDQGIAAGSAAQNFVVAFDPKNINDFMKSGIISTMGFEVSKSGVYRVKVLVKDANSNKIGTISQNIYVPDAEAPISFSGLLLQTFTPAEYEALQKNPAAANPQKMQVDTAFRHYKKGQVLTYTYALNLSPKISDGKVLISTKLVKDGHTVFTGAPEDLPAVPGQRVNRRNAVNLGTDMKPGKYTLQITAAGDKSKAAETQSIDFEIVD